MYDDVHTGSAFLPVLRKQDSRMPAYFTAAQHDQQCCVVVRFTVRCRLCSHGLKIRLGDVSATSTTQPPQGTTNGAYMEHFHPRLPEF